MNTDSAFWIGKDHVICEDYSLASTFLEMGYAVVSDGCSASPDVDFGARALAMSAKRALRLGTDIGDAKKFGDGILANASKCFDLFPYLSPQALDATLLVAWVENKKVTAYLYGDGLYVHKNKTGTNVVHISLTSGAPDYLSYHLDPIRRQSYEALEGNRKELTCESLGEAGVFNTGKLLEPVIMKADVQEGDIIAVISDGINSFRTADNTPIDWRDLVNEFVGFKTTEGEFALRRLSAFKRKCEKEGIKHSDDISIAAIVV